MSRHDCAECGAISIEFYQLLSQLNGALKTQETEVAENSQLPIVGAATYSWRFAIGAFLTTLPAYMVRAIVTGAVSAAAVSGMAGGVLPLDFLGQVLALLVTVSCLAMTIRLAMTGEMKGLTGLKFDMEETRLLFANLFFIAVAFFLAFVAIILASIVMGILIAMLVPDLEAIAQNQRAAEAFLADFFVTPAGIVIMILMFLMVGFPLLYISARLVNFPAATIARQKMMIFETWDWTKDQVWRVIGAIVLAMAPVVLISFLGVWVAGALTGLPVLGDAGALAATSPIAAFAFGVITGLFSIPSQLVGAALAVFMYRGFEPDRRTDQF